MRISNISKYLGGADNVIAKEIIQGDQFVYQFKLGTQDFTNYRFEVDTQLFNSSITRRGSSINFTTLEPVAPAATHSYQNFNTDISQPAVQNSIIQNGGIVLDQTDNTVGNLIIPSTLLSDLTTTPAPANSDTPPVVVMSVTLNSMGSPAIRQSFRMLWIVRYRPMA